MTSCQHHCIVCHTFSGLRRRRRRSPARDCVHPLPPFLPGRLPHLQRPRGVRRPRGQHDRGKEAAANGGTERRHRRARGGGEGRQRQLAAHGVPRRTHTGAEGQGTGFTKCSSQFPYLIAEKMLNQFGLEEFLTKISGKIGTCILHCEFSCYSVTQLAQMSLELI
jgi:hypothetical protein